MNRIQMFNLVRIVLYTGILCFFSFSLFSQKKYYDFGFNRYDLIKVYENDKTLKYAWNGGLNACQFGSIDLNFDGISDLVIFDRIGNKILPFLNKGLKDSSDFIFAPDYRFDFPDIMEWMQLIDYDNDGLEDIFTYGFAGISVYKNISIGKKLKFVLITPLLNAKYASSRSNIPVTSVDYPAIADFDADGDLDILVFFTLGSYCYYFKNVSVEKYGIPDSLDFELAQKCWGNFAESELNNKIFLNVSCPWKCNKDVKKNKAIEHTGSTMLALDIDNDNDMDLILGDVDFSNLILLNNGGNKDSAVIVSYDTLFPDPAKPVNLTSFPVPSYIDINNDGLKDLIVSPFDPSFNISENLKSVHLYINSGSVANARFSFKTDAFLQQDMIDVGAGAYPVLFDIDKDGLFDLFVANYGFRDSSFFQNGFLKSNFVSRIAFYKNTGTAYKPAFTLIDKDFAALSQYALLALYPAFIDIDDDGDIDMLAGNADGTLILFRNIGGTNINPVYEKEVKFQNIDVGEFSTPQFIDINNDGLMDLVIGKRKGSFSYFRNYGTKAQPVFNLISDKFGKVNVTDTLNSYYGYSTPCFFRDKSNKLKLFAGSDQGKIYYYSDIDNNLEGSFFLNPPLLYNSDTLLFPFKEGIRTGAAIAYLTNNNYPDMIIGNYSGGLSFFKGAEPAAYYESIGENNIKPGFALFPNPASKFFYIFLNIHLPAYEVAVYNLMGACLFKSTYNSDKIKINVENFDKGLYFIIVKSNNYLSSQKLIINAHP